MKKILLCLLISLNLSGCFSVGTSAPSKFYSLKNANVDDITPVSQKFSKIGVEEIKIPTYLDKPQIVLKAPNSVELSFSEANRWSEPLSSMMQRTLANDISLYMPKALVKPRYLGQEKFDYLVFVEIEKFEGALNSQANLVGWWYIANKNGDVIITKKANISLKTNNNFDDLIQTESTLVNELAKQIATTLSATIK